MSYGTSPLGGPFRWRIHSRETALFLLCAPRESFLAFLLVLRLMLQYNGNLVLKPELYFGAIEPS